MNAAADWCVREVEATQAHALAALHNQAFEVPWDQETISALLALDGARGWSAIPIDGGTPLGFLMTRQIKQEAEILTLACAASHRRMGMARGLVGHAVEVLKCDGVDQLFLEVAVDNTAALGLYKEMAFVTVGRRRNYYARRSGGRVDALILRRRL